MGHRQLFSSSQMFENVHDPNWNYVHSEQPYMHLARAGTSENGPIAYPVENMSIDGAHLSHWNPVTRSSVYPSSCHNVELPHYHPDVPGPSHVPLLHPPVTGNFCIAQENYAPYASSSSYERKTFHGMDSGFGDHAINSGRGTYKRKSPGIPAVCEGASTSRYYGSGSSTDISISSEVRMDKQPIDCPHSVWDPVVIPPGYRANHLPMGGEGSLRNVRSRPALELESNLARTYLATNPLPHHYTAGHPIDHASAVNPSGQSLGEWNQIHVPPMQWRAPVPEATGIRHETNHFLVGSNTASASVDVGGYHHDFSSSRNPVVSQNLLGTSSQCVRGVRSGYAQGSTPAYRAASSNLRVGQFGMSDDGVDLVSDNFSSRSSRPVPVIGWRNGERNGRSRISNERYRSFSDDSGIRDPMASEALMFHVSRNMLDQHRDMRLDVDNMSYEELLALGEQIGSVSTGLSEDLIRKGLTETIYRSSDQVQEEGRCVICLEEYNNKDNIGTLNSCGHDYHVGCIRKWLSMKNTCPICKASAVADDMK